MNFIKKYWLGICSVLAIAISGFFLCANECSIKKHPELSKLLPVIENINEFSEKMNREMSEASACLEGILMPENILNPEKLLESKKLLAIYADKLNGFQKGYFEEINLTRSELKKAFAENGKMKKHLLLGFEKSIKTTNELMKEFFQVEKESAQRIAAIINFFSERNGLFWESEGTLVFENEEDLNIFNQLNQNFYDSCQKEELIVSKIEKHRQSAIEKLDQFRSP